MMLRMVLTSRSLKDHGEGGLYGLKRRDFINHLISGRAVTLRRSAPIEPERAKARVSRSTDVCFPRVADHDAFRGLTLQAFERNSKDFGGRFGVTAFLGCDHMIDERTETACS